MPNSRLNGYMTNPDNYLKIYFECNRELFSRINVDEIYSAITKYCFCIIKRVKICLLLLPDYTKKKFCIVNSKGIDLKKLKKVNFDFNAGIAGELLNKGIKKIITNQNNLSEYIPKNIITKESIKTMISLPLKYMDVVFGILNIYLTERENLSLLEETMLETLAVHATIAIENATLRNEYSSLRDELSSLYKIADYKTKQFITLKKISEALSQRKSLKEILEIIANESLDIVGHGNKVVFVMLIDEEKKLLETKTACGELLREKHLNFCIPLSKKSVVTWVVNNSKYKVVQDISKDSEYFKVFPSTKSEICFPLFSRNKVIGVINIESSKLKAFSDQDLELLQTLANQAGVAIENTRLNERIAETQFRLRKTIESAVIDEALKRFTHDIKTHTALIRGDVDWIKKLYNKDSLTNEELFNTIENIIDSTKNIGNLTKKMSRRFNASPPLFKKTNLFSAIEEVLYTFSVRMKKQGVLQNLKDKSLQFFIDIDKDQIMTSFNNFIENALDAMENGGVLTIKGMKRKTGFAYIKIIDTGKGISKNEINKIWNITFSKKSTGTGFGLTICKSIIEINHKGKISINSVKNEGTTVTIRLPLIQKNN
ncbi:MAG: GAF domain-containing protein [Candidatus Hodarchaeota archaeon]